MTKGFSIKTFLIATFLVGFITFLSLAGAGAVDEGTEGEGALKVVAHILAKIFVILRFPAHPLFSAHLDGTKFFWGLLFNTVFYSLIIERVIWWIKNKKAGKYI